MKKWIQLTMICLVAMLLGACGSSTSSPSAAATALAKNLQKGDYKAIVNQMYFDKENLSADEIKQQKAMMEGLFEEKASKTIEEKGGIKKFEVVEETISEDGKSAEVTMKYEYGDGSTETESNDFVLVDGKWYFELDK